MWSLLLYAQQLDYDNMTEPVKRLWPPLSKYTLIAFTARLVVTIKVTKARMLML